MQHKICVYAICKNEEKHIDRWINSLKEADKIVVLDTGSTDSTIEKLQAYAPLVEVYQKEIIPWRFDTARNESMKYIPSDTTICVVSDCD
jgi:glycosyltransferase involved in cell wall biosynthesis